MFWCGQFPISFPANSPSKRVWIEDWNLSIGLDLLYYRYYIYIYGWWFQIYFSIIYGIILPIDELIFFRGVGIPPTIYIYTYYIYIYQLRCTSFRWTPCGVDDSTSDSRCHIYCHPVEIGSTRCSQQTWPLNTFDTCHTSEVRFQHGGKHSVADFA